MSTSELPVSASAEVGRNDAATTDATPAIAAEIAALQVQPWARLVLEALLGGTLEGADLLPRLLRAGARTAASSGGGQMAAEPHAPGAVQAALGLGEDLRGGVRRSMAMARRVTGWLPRPRPRRPPVLVEMALTAGEIAVDQGRMVVVHRWVRLGQREEARARLVARLLASGALDAVLLELAQRPEVRALIEQQSKELAASSLDEIRQRASAVDGAVERAAERFLHLPERQ